MWGSLFKVWVLKTTPVAAPGRKAGMQITLPPSVLELVRIGKRAPPRHPLKSLPPQTNNYNKPLRLARRSSPDQGEWGYPGQPPSSWTPGRIAPPSQTLEKLEIQIQAWVWCLDQSVRMPTCPRGSKLKQQTKHEHLNTVWLNVTEAFFLMALRSSYRDRRMLPCPDRSIPCLLDSTGWTGWRMTQHGHPAVLEWDPAQRGWSSPTLACQKRNPQSGWGTGCVFVCVCACVLVCLCVCTPIRAWTSADLVEYFPLMDSL